MNPYLSSDEKENYVRVFALSVLLDMIIDGYASAKSTSKTFLKFLRMGRTFLRKAIKIRNDALDPGAYDEFVRQANRLEFVCVPKLAAKREFDDLMRLKSTMPMARGDFEDWYESVIETTCKGCRCSDYATCKIRAILQKYGVYPVNPGARGVCQYDYKEAST